jgi:hypothetical protein
LRAAVTELLDRAAAYGCRAVVVEHLGFDDMRSTGRERYGSKKWSRKVVCSIPTAQFRGRLVAMASRRGTAVLSVPAAYSSIWGAEHWQGPLSDKNYQVPRHTAAAVVLGRRALGHSARRRPQASPGVTAGGQRTEDAVVAEATVSTAPGESYHVGAKGSPGVRHHALHEPFRHQGDPARGHKTRSGNAGLGGARPAKTVRAGPRSATSSG